MGISVLIPARDEASGIQACISAVLASQNVELEVIVLDDGSTDGTGDRVRELISTDSRVRLIEGSELPEGWNGKQHACWKLSQEAQMNHFVFLDADVRLKPDALEKLASSFKEQRPAEQPIGLLSAFPLQQTETFFEKLLIPMMHYVLLCYLPFRMMRSDGAASFAAGCGQLFYTERKAYKEAGTHASIKSSRHDGVKLPRAFRNAGWLSDCIDGSKLATCRMYRSASEVFRGLLKNASEGIANPRLILPFTILLGGANLLPYLILLAAFYGTLSPLGTIGSGSAIVLACLAIMLGWLPRLWSARRLRQSWLGAACHPLAITIFLFLQWMAFFMYLTGQQVAWRGRTQS